MTETYASILAELMRRRDVLAAELRSVNTAIDAIKPLVPGETTVAPAVFRAVQTPAPAAQIVDSEPVSEPHQTGDYSRISVRWAALWHLGEFARGPMRNGAIADAILAGGYRTGAGSFPNAVSAVLSGMRTKGEIDGNQDVGYWLTDKGQQIWAVIKQSERFRSVMAHASHGEPTLLSVQ